MSTIKSSELIYLISETLYHLTNISPFSPSLWSLVTTTLIFVSISSLFFRFYIAVTSRSICLSLTYFTSHNAPKVHSHCCKWQNLIIFLWLINIYLVFFIHSCDEATHGCFQTLTVVNNAAMKIGVQINIMRNIFFTIILKQAIWIAGFT